MTRSQEDDRSRSRGVYAISIAAEMVSMQIQNLRVYERRGLVAPDRTSGGSRLYSPDDIDRLHRVRELLAEGLNLAGIAHVIALEERVRHLEGRLRRRDDRDPSEQ
ncbi:MerR family transcriptional regulator [Nocardioides hankookensis]|uniref:MerR family transcriptional regulator n=1 Tax=Nocardioides hankookensis TaxID=443157 RepID=A0ABW1LI90_9ACTN